MFLKSLENCELKIGNYPKFNYDARGGGGEATIERTEQVYRYNLDFKTDDFFIPSLNWRTTKLLGIPIPPGLEIKIHTDKLNGHIDFKSGHLSLKFKARFSFTIISLMQAPDLIVETCLENEEVNNSKHQMIGKAIQEDGKTILVGFSTIPKTGNYLLDSFLDLPNKAKALLRCEVKY